MDYYKKDVEEVIKDLDSNINGITSEEVKIRLKKYGKNEIKKIKKISSLKIFIEQFKSFIIYILLAAAALAFILNEKTDAIVILIIVLLNALFGFFQEYKAEKSIEALIKLSSPTAIVIRDKKTVSIDASQLVPGDVIVIEEGSYIPADSRLIETSSLYTDESTLTGESTTVSKNAEIIKKDTIISNQHNMVFAGTIASRGRAKAIVVGTGSDTELGKIAKEIQITAEKITPLQKKLHSLGIYITISILTISAVILLLGFFRGLSLADSILTAISIAVASIPEGLPAAVTITLALGTQRMVKKNALVRRLSAVESLGSVTVIATDKTGTLTKNEMTVKKIFTNKKLIDVTGTGYEIKGEFLHNNKKLENKELENLMQVASLCNNASLEGPSDPTEKALLVASKKAGYNKSCPRLKEIPFSSETKYMVTLNKVNNNLIYNLKGAPEVVLGKCNKILVNNKEHKLTKDELEQIKIIYNSMAAEALRVLGFAYSNDEKNYTFIGLMGMIDPPREEVSSYIEVCKKAGIKVVMITGDHALTAKAIASDIGIQGDTITGEELEKIDIKDLPNVIDTVTVYARVTPQHKVKILDALKAKNHIVAMIGDGVNDAIALKKSDVGTSVGAGTDVAKEASDIVLLDNNFVSIVNAIKEGRGIYNNIKKFILYLFSCNLAEVAVVFISLLIGLPLPLIAVQILWMNLLTDGLPALALGIDKIEEDVMYQPPRNPKEKIITKKDTIFLLIQAAAMTTLTILMFSYYLNTKSINYAQTIAFSSIVFMQLFNAINYHSGNKSILKAGIFSNKYLIWAIIISFILQLFVIYIINDIFKTIPLKIFDFGIVLVVAFFIIIIQELIKYFSRTEVNV